MKSSVIKIVSSLLLCYGSAFVGSVLTLPFIPTWYSLLNKPPLNPPNWVFGPVWTVLFTLMAVAFFIVWNSKKHAKLKSHAMKIFGIQLFLNILWSFFFFYLHSPLLAALEIVIFWIMIALTIKAFYPIRKLAAYLLVPYILWVSFASYLTIGVWLLNP